MSAFNTIWRVISGPVSILLISIYTSQENQGYYYVFFNLLAAQQLFEAGIGFGLLRILSKNQKDIYILDNNLDIKGDDKNNILNYLSIAVFWFITVSVIVLIIILPSGYKFLSNSSNTSNTEWVMPWILFGISNAILIALSPISMILEGGGERDHVYKSRFIISIIGTISTWFSLYIGAQLYSLSISNLMVVLCSLYYYIPPIYKSISKIYSVKNIRLDSLKIFIKDQWRISTVWSTGYFAWNILPIIIFRLSGATVAGQFGMTNGVLTTISQFASTSINTKASYFGAEISNGHFIHAKRIFEQGIKLSCTLFVMGIISLICLWVIIPELSVFKRMLPISDFLILAIYVFLIMLTTSMGLFGRMLHNEPFFKFALSSNLLIPLVVITTGYFFIDFRTTLIFLVFTQLILIFWARLIYINITRDFC